MGRIKTKADSFKESDQNFNMYSLAQFMFKVVEQTSGNIEVQKILKDLIDSMFERYTIKMYMAKLYSFISFCFVPILILVFGTEFVGKSLCIFSAFTIQVILTMMEFIQMMPSPWTYFKDVQNQIDFFTTVVSFTFLIISSTFGLLELPVNEDTPIEMVLLVITVITLSFLKLLYFVKIYEQFGQLIQLLIKCIKDLKNFSFFLLVWMAFFTVFYALAGV